MVLLELSAGILESSAGIIRVICRQTAVNLIPCSGVLPISRVLYTQYNIILTSVVGDKKKTAIMIMRIDSKRERQ